MNKTSMGVLVFCACMFVVVSRLNIGASNNLKQVHEQLVPAPNRRSSSKKEHLNDKLLDARLNKEIELQRDFLKEGLTNCNANLERITSRLEEAEKSKGKQVTVLPTKRSAHKILAKVEVKPGAWHLFLDETSIIGSEGGVALQMHSPTRAEKVLRFDEVWEGPSSTYVTAISIKTSKDHHLTRVYYRCYSGELDLSFQQKTCVAESMDGKTFEKPKLSIYKMQYNAIYQGVEAHNFAPFLDANPNSLPDEKFKAVGGIDPTVFPYNVPHAKLARLLQSENQPLDYKWGLYAFTSEDGLRWKRSKKPVITKVGLDSLNNVFFHDGEYTMYGRFWAECPQCLGGSPGGGQKQHRRSIFVSRSKDFISWSPLKEVTFVPKYPGEEGLYTNAIIQLPDVPNVLVGFPKRFSPLRHKIKEHPESGVSDTVLISSNAAGEIWTRQFKEAFIRPGRSRRNWSQRSNMVATGMRFDKEGWSMYAVSHYQWDDCHLQRLWMRPYGFSSIHGSYSGGQATSAQIVFPIDDMRSGKLKRKLSMKLNFATSAFGIVRVDLLYKPVVTDESAAIVLSSRDMYGDSLEEEVVWQASRPLDDSNLPNFHDTILATNKNGDAGVFFFQFHLTDADVFAWKVD